MLNKKIKRFGSHDKNGCILLALHREVYNELS